MISKLVEYVENDILVISSDQRSICEDDVSSSVVVFAIHVFMRLYNMMTVIHAYDEENVQDIDIYEALVENRT